MGKGIHTSVPKKTLSQLPKRAEDGPTQNTVLVAKYDLQGGPK